jgi:sugar phosphate permease
MKKNNKLFYGWWMVIVFTIVFIIGNAAPFAIVLKQLMEQFHTGRGEVSVSQSILMGTAGITGIFVGRMLNRYSPKRFFLWGAIVGGVSSLLLSFSNGLWFLYIFSLIAGVAGGFSNAIVMFTLLSRWFTRKWGTAIGIVMAGASIGGMAIQPLVGIIAVTFGWRATYLFAGSLALAINVPLILFIVKDNPKSMDLLPDGDKVKEIIYHSNDQLPIEENNESVPTSKNNQLFSYLKSPSFWLMGVSFAFVSVGYSAITGHEVSFITDMRISETLAASARGITLGIGAISALASGWLADRLVSRYVTILFFLLATVGMLILIQATSMSSIWLFVAVFGLGTGAFGTLLPMVTRDIFSSTNFGTVFGLAVVFLFAGNAIGVPLAGFMFDASGSYHSVFIIITAIYAAAILGIYFAFGANPKPLIRLSYQKSKKTSSKH